MMDAIKQLFYGGSEKQYIELKNSVGQTSGYITKSILKKNNIQPPDLYKKLLSLKPGKPSGKGLKKSDQDEEGEEGEEVDEVEEVEEVDEGQEGEEG